MTLSQQTVIDQISARIMYGVVDMLKSVGRKPADCAQCHKVICDEIEAFLTGPQYADERHCLIHNTVHEAYIFRSVCASAFSKIQLA